MTRKNPSRSKKAITLDKHALYEASVQNPEHDVSIVADFYRDINGKSPRTIREDFCGTFSFCCEWVRRHPKNKAIGIDLCADTLDYGRQHHLTKLSPEEQSRVTLLRQNVQSKTKKCDVIVACNFSYFIFRTRKEMLKYFRCCLRSLKDDGALVLDFFGGPEAETVLREKRTVTNDQIKSFSYIWDLQEFNPITREGQFYIHFRYGKDGPRLDKAFSYYWRMWSIRELRDMLEEVGFKSSHVYWESDDGDGEGDGTFYRTEKEDNEPTYLGYLVATKAKTKPIGKLGEPVAGMMEDEN